MQLLRAIEPNNKVKRLDKDLVNKVLSGSGNTKTFYKLFVKNSSTNAGIIPIHIFLYKASEN